MNSDQFLTSDDDDKNMTYNTKVTDYGNGIVEIVRRNRNSKKMKEGYRLSEAELELRRNAILNADKSEEAQKARTQAQHFQIKKRLKNKILCNDFDWFVTFTFDDSHKQVLDSKDYDCVKKLLSNWCSYMRKLNGGQFNWVFIPELHPTSGRFHWHGLLQDIDIFEFQEAINPKTNQSIIRDGRPVYNLNNWKFGFSDCQRLTNDEHKEKISSYVSKYITKSLSEGTTSSMYKKPRYISARGMKQPDVTYITTDENEYAHLSPTLAIIDKTEVGNSLDLAIYKQHIDPETGLDTTISVDSVYKLKEEVTPWT